MSCECIDPRVFTQARNGVTSALTLTRGQTLDVNFVSDELYPTTLWIRSTWAQKTEKPGPFELFAVKGQGIFQILFDASGQFRLLDGRRIFTTAPDGENSVEFEFTGWVPGIKVRNVTVRGGEGTPMPTVTCFENQYNATTIDTMAACSACTSDNIVAGCLDVKLGSLSSVEIIVGVAAFVIIAMMIKRFI